jgi:uncharacterized protein (TIGR01777 family)
MRIVLAGGTGFVGKALRSRLLEAGHELIVLTRRAGAGENGREKFIFWDGKTSGEWVDCLDGTDAVINLAGENIAAKRWTCSRKQEILESRVNATRAIVEAIKAIRQKPSLLINASAVGYYGDDPDRELTEKSLQGEGFLAETCAQWEAEARKAETLGVRVILARLGPVLGENGGMLAKMLPPFRCFLGAPLGTGRQWIPWVHRDDVTEIFLFLLGRQDLSGPVNVVAGAPATMREFCLVLAKVLRRPCWPPVPSFFLRMLMGEMAAIVLSSQKVMPERLLKAGYRPRHRDLTAAISGILKKAS